MLGEDSLADVYVAEEARVEDAVWLDGDNLGDVDTVVEVPKVLDIFEEYDRVVLVDDKGVALELVLDV